MIKFVMLGSLDVDDTVDDGVSHVYSFGTKLPCQRLIQCSQGEFTSRERSTIG